MTINQEPTKPASLPHAALSFVIPGAGQFLAGKRGRGISILLSFLILAWLSTWTIAQRARFPDLNDSRILFIPIFLQTLALLIFIVALWYLVSRYLLKDPASRPMLNIGMGILYLIALILIQDRILSFAGDEEDLRTIYGVTAIFSAASLAAFHIWNVRDAGRIGSRPAKMPSFIPGILFLCLVILFLGWRITEIDLPKAISEYEDTSIILSRIFWPWEAAFEYDEEVVETLARIQAPCPEGATGPEVNQPKNGEAWVSVTPTCGDLSDRDLATGDLTFGTELSITGGGFVPNATVELLWKNPIGNPFKPRGVGETDLQVDRNGNIESSLFIPEVVIPSTAVGDQVHSLIIRQESGEVFTGNLSEDMLIALTLMLETIMIGLMATFFGVIFAFPFSFLAARNLMSPITAIFHRIVGGMVGLGLAFLVLRELVGPIIDAFGTLEEAPIQIASILLLLVIILWFAGWRLGGALFGWLSNSLPPVVGKVVTALGFGTLTAGFGYLLGIGFVRGVVSIPLAGIIPDNLEENYALGGAVLLGVAGLAFGYFRAMTEFGLGMVVYSIARTLMNIVRSIEPLIWAIVGAIWVGLGPFAGTIALTLHTIAALGKLYSESIESIDHGPLEALQATGANRLQTIIYAVVPQILPPYISFTIYRWDINVRMSTIIGAVGGGGIGFILFQWIRLFNYESAGLAVWLITITVATLDYVSSNIRERFV